MTITQEDADARLANDLHAAEHTVNGLVTVPMTQNQFDALVSLCFNIGSGNFAHSTLLRLMNEGDTAGASGQFLAWCKTDGQVNQGLLNRRHAEMQLFDTEVAG